MDPSLRTTGAHDLGRRGRDELRRGEELGLTMGNRADHQAEGQEGMDCRTTPRAFTSATAPHAIPTAGGEHQL